MSYIKHKSDESLEDYLETILSLQNNTGNVRSIDIANELEYSKPSISIAMKKLKEKGLITMDRNNIISLTDEGRNIAETVLERHNILTEMLVGLGVSPEVAMEDACRIEHDLSKETFEAIKRHLGQYRQ